MADHRICWLAVHSIRFEYLYDINQLGQQYMYTNKDNMFLALKRQKDTRAVSYTHLELLKSISDNFLF